MTAVIAGASGLTGSKLLQLLLADREVDRVVSVGRRSLGVSSQKLEEVLIEDFGKLSSVGDRLGGEIYFCCLGSTIKAAGSREAFRKIDFDAVADFAKIAKKSGATSFALVSASGANAGSKIFYNRVKGEIEGFLKDLGLRSLILARPGLLIGERKEHRTVEALAISALRKASPLLPSGFKVRVATNVDKLAEVLLREGKRAAPGVHILGALALA